MELFSDKEIEECLSVVADIAFCYKKDEVSKICLS
jgi:hypothetical protein